MCDFVAVGRGENGVTVPWYENTCWPKDIQRVCPEESKEPGTLVKIGRRKIVRNRNGNSAKIYLCSSEIALGAKVVGGSCLRIPQIVCRELRCSKHTSDRPYLQKGVIPEKGKDSIWFMVHGTTSYGWVPKENRLSVGGRSLNLPTLVLRSAKLFGLHLPKLQVETAFPSLRTICG